MSIFKAGRAAVFVGLVVSSLLVAAQGPAYPTVKYTQEQWSLNPPKYMVRVDTMGMARYESTPNSTEQSGDVYTIEFTISNANKDKIFRMLQDLNFFNNTVDDVSPADGAARSLTYAYGETLRIATYHGTSNQTAQQLTKLFQSISLTLETARRLDKLHQKNDSTLNDVVKRMLERAQAGDLAELQLAVPALKSIAADTTVPAATRSQVQSIIKIATPPPSQSQSYF